MSKLEDKAVEIITQLQHLAPSVSNAALQTARIDALSNGAQGILSLFLAIAIVIFWIKIYWPWVKLPHDEFNGGPPRFLAGAALSIAGAVFAAVSLFGLLDPWLYIAYFHPELWLAHKVIG